MQLVTLILSALALAPAGSLAWTKDAKGVWVANNKWYENVNGYRWVHESCTTMNTKRTHEGGYCAYWVNAQGKQQHGYCKKNTNENRLFCRPGCPDPFSPCQLSEDNGKCKRGYGACLEKMGCSGRSGGADCIGRSLGCASACG